MKTENPLLPDGVAESWFHVHAGGEVWTSRVCRGVDLLTVLDGLIQLDERDAERLAEEGNWYCLDGKCRAISFACGEDPDVEITLIDDPSFAMPLTYNGNTWHVLSSITRGKELVELLAATSDDGIGVIARWKRRDDSGWDVTAMDTESDEGMKPVTDFHDGECVPAIPPITVPDRSYL